MLIKNNMKILLICILSFLTFNLSVGAEEFDVSAKEIIIDKEKEILIGKGSVVVKDSEGKKDRKFL